LVSNDLWGGAGSIADHSLVNDRGRQRQLWSLLVRLGKLQLDAGKINVRTEIWVTTFEQWLKTLS
jgi:hypothetical protein